MTWDCTWQGPGANPIATLFQVKAYPTVFILDAKGRIRFKNLRGDALIKAVDELLAEIE